MGFGAWHTVAGYTQCGTLLDTRWNSHLESFITLNTSCPATLLTGMIDDGANTMAGRAGNHLLDENVPFLATAQHLATSAAACVTTARWCAGFGPRSVATCALHQPR